LRVVNVGGCYSISDVSLRVIANLHLVHVNLAMTTITDESLILIANRCPFLLSINLYGAQHITHRGVSILLQSCRKLTSINLRGTSIGVDGLGVLREMAHIHCEVLTGNLLQVLFCNDFYFDWFFKSKFIEFCFWKSSNITTTIVFIICKSYLLFN